MGVTNKPPYTNNRKMSDSGASQAGNDYNTKAEDLEVVFDEEENEDVFDMTPSNRNLQRMPYLSRSFMNLATSSPYSPRSLSRSDSTSSLASPMGSLSALSPLPVSDIKNLTNDYQKLLKQATREIKKLNLDVKRMEQEQAKILQENVDLALETKGLMLDQKALKKDEQALIKANDEFAAEVERLYNVEEQQAKEIEDLQNQIQELQNKFSELNEKHLEEENNLKTEIVHLTEALNTANGKSTRILDKVKSVEEQYSSSLEYVKSSYENGREKLEAKINSLEHSLDKEKELRKEGDIKVSKLTEDFKKSKEELDTLFSKNHDNLINVEEEVAKLKEENEKLKSEIIDLADENAALQNDQFEQLEQEQNWEKEKDQLNLEAELLRNTQKFLNDKTEKVKKELKDESERVKQLNILNKMVTAENEWLKTNLKNSQD